MLAADRIYLAADGVGVACQPSLRGEILEFRGKDQTMRRGEFRKYFKSMGPVVLPVIHVLDSSQAKRNLATVIECGAPGAFLINHDFDVDRFLPIIEDCILRKS